MSGQPSRRVVLAVRVVKVGATTTAALTALVLTLGGAIANPADDGAAGATEPSVRVAEQSDLVTRCVGAGGRAIVMTTSGETRTVPFKQGWKIYRGERPGTLLAVCPG